MSVRFYFSARLGRSLQVIGFGGIIFFLFYYFVHRADFGSQVQEMVRITGVSMSPLIHSGQVVTHEPGFYRRHSVRKGDLITVRQTGVASVVRLVKRVVATPGDQVESRIGFLYVNGSLVRNSNGIEYQIKDSVLDAVLEMQPWVPENQVLLLGESVADSLDSRQLGFFSFDHIEGRINAQ